MKKNSVYTSEEDFISKLIIPFLVERNLTNKIILNEDIPLIELAIEQFSTLNSYERRKLALKIYALLKAKQ